MNLKKRNLPIEKLEYYFEDIVYLKIAKDSDAGMVTGITFFPMGGIMYEVTWKETIGKHYGMELSSTPFTNFQQTEEEET